MGLTRRRALVTLAGFTALPGCAALDGSGPPVQGSPERTTATTTTEPPETPDPPTEGVPDRVADVYIYERDGQYRVVGNGAPRDRESDDLGRVINDAQAALSEGSILVAAAGVSATAIGHEDDVAVAGIDGRTALTPADGADTSFDMYRTPDGPDGGRLASFLIDMENRGRSAIRSAGSSDLEVEGVRVRNTPAHGLSIDDGRSAAVRDCRFTDIGEDAIHLVDSSDVAIHDCTSIGAKYGIHASDSSALVVRGYRSRDTRLNGVAIYDYTENWRVIGCRAVNDGHTPFAASPARDGSFIGCIAEGTTTDGEGGFEIEYKAGHDADGREEPVEGCSVVSCTAIDCHMGFYAREDDSEETTDTRVIRPRFIDCAAIGCDTGLFIDGNVVEAIIRDFDAVDCATDVVDRGTRTMIDDRSENEGDPAAVGQWNGHAQTAAEFDVTVEDTESGNHYRATEGGSWEQID